MGLILANNLNKLKSEIFIMYYFITRYAALKSFPNAIVRKIKSIHYLSNAGEYVIFNDYTTYSQWKNLGYVK